MPGPADILRELHRLRRHLTELDEKVKEAPRALKTQQTRLANQEEAYRQAQDGLKQLKVKIHEKEVSIKAAAEQVKKYERQLKEQITSKKEYDALNAEIKAARETIARIEDEALAEMTESEERQAKLPQVEEAVKKARADFAQYEKDHAARLERHGEEKRRAQEELKAVEATLPGDARALYTRLVTAKGADALAAVHGRICAECYTEITSQMSQELARGIFMLCKNCGRMLYPEG